MSSWLSRDTFRTIVDTTPLISIDLLVRDAAGRILVGKRVNRPAQGFWFVPGGRILKNETIADAFFRLTENELGKRTDIRSARYLGLYEHFYDDSIFSDEGLAVSTHYIVNGFEIHLPENQQSLPYEQHNEYLWMTEDDFRHDPGVHIHSRWYLDDSKGFKNFSVR